MSKQVVKQSSASITEAAQRDFADRIAAAVAAVPLIRIDTRVGRCGHQGADILSADGSFGERKGLTAALPRGHTPVRKQLPTPGCPPFDRVLAGPELNEIVPRVRLCPIDADRLQVLFAGQIEYDPLRVNGVVCAREALCQVGVALPESGRIAIRQT